MQNNGYTADPTGAHVTVSDLTTIQDVPRPTGGDMVVFQNGAQPIRYTLDDSDPTASHGFRMAANEYREIPVGKITKLRVLNEGSASTLQYQFFNYLRADY